MIIICITVMGQMWLPNRNTQQSNYSVPFDSWNEKDAKQRQCHCQRSNNKSDPFSTPVAGCSSIFVEFF